MDDTASAALNTTVFIALVALAVVLGYSIRTSGFRYATEVPAELSWLHVGLSRLPCWWSLAGW